MGTADNLTDHLLREGTLALRAHSDSAQLDAQLLLAHALAQPRSHLIASAGEAVPGPAVERYRTLLRRRRSGEPVAYLTGEREFWSLCLRVSPAVLVPRPETELVVERALALLPARGPAPGVTVQVADLGTGSGAIALALAVERPAWQVLATDRSAAALGVARDNAQRLGVRNISFLEGDWCVPLAGRQLDAIVSNPPYVAALDPAMAQLRHEPAAALSPGPRGLEALEAIIHSAAPVLRPGGILVLEHGTSQARAVAAALVAAGFAHVRCYHDLAGHDRVTEAHWPGA
jgi:release factor glutamine methyltransferase